MNKLPELLTLVEASEWLKVHPNSLRNWERMGLLKSKRVGDRRLRRYTRESLLEFINDQEV